MAKRILVVDDDPDLREATEIVLRGAGYDVLLAESGAAAMKTLQANDVDLVLLDVMMETETEGFHIVYKIRQDARLKDVPIVILTCIEEKTGEVLQPEKAGDYLPVQGFLRKPMEAKTLKAKIQELIGN